MVDPFTSMIDSVYLPHQPVTALRFQTEHPEYATHMMKILPLTQKYVLVPLGPPLPRYDRDSSREAYCRLMLILFKPWIIATDLKAMIVVTIGTEI